MAGIINSDDIATVRDRVKIEEIVGEHVALRGAGIGALKGLCPFHDERTPSFHVRPQVGMWHCFGCGEGGDTIDFVQRIHRMSFVEAVEYLAAKVGVVLRYEDAGNRQVRRPDLSMRQRVLEANQIAEVFYREQLKTPQAQEARRFLGEKAFGPQDAQLFGVGYAPAGWDTLTHYLRGRGFTEAELAASGLCSRGQRGLYDRFRDRVIWPIRDITGATVGFGARRLGDDGPKYLNTPETDYYKKSQVLYGLDIAKRDIVKKRQIVIVEGYTDVMAAHLAGITTAVATCGTAFGEDHARLVRRIVGDAADPAAGVVLADGSASGAEIIFTFDGDEAGQKAALKAFQGDQNFAAQTFVAVADGGLDPCDLRLQQGNEAVCQLVASRIPLFEFVLRSILRGQDLRVAEGRVRALHAAVPIVVQIRDRALRSEYTRQLASWLGMNVRDVMNEVARVVKQPPVNRDRSGLRSHSGIVEPVKRGGELSKLQPTRDPIERAERMTLAGILQFPWFAIGHAATMLSEQSFMVPTHRGVWIAIAAIGGLDTYNQLVAANSGVADAYEVAAKQWQSQIVQAAGAQMLQVINALLVMPLPIAVIRPESSTQERLRQEQDAAKAYVQGLVSSAARLGINRQIGQLRADLGIAVAGSAEYQHSFTKLMELEKRRRSLMEE